MKQEQKPKQFELLGANLAALNLAVRFNAASGYQVRERQAAGASLLARTPAPAAPQVAALSEAEPFANPADVQPQDADFIYPVFRALSAAITRPSMEGLVLDFSTPGVLEAGAALLAGQTVYKNHWSYDVEDFLGVVNAAVFDAAGADVEGIPGINAELKIDKRVAPKIARGLLMEPPAINAVSVQVHFKFEYSHPRLVEEGSFWRNVGEEIDGELVRLIVTEIAGFGELSLVNRGADKFNRRLPDMTADDDGLPPTPGTEVEAETGKKKKEAGMSSQLQGEKTVKLKQGTIAALGLQGDESTDFPESAVLSGLPGLTEKAALGTQLLTSLREEVTASALRAAALTHKGEGQPALDVRDKLLIDKADAAELATLKTHYEGQASAGLSATCQKCGSTVTSLRSSVDSQTGPNVASVPRVNVI